MQAWKEGGPTLHQQCPHTGHNMLQRQLNSPSGTTTSSAWLPQALLWRVLPPGDKAQGCTLGFLPVSIG